MDLVPREISERPPLLGVVVGRRRGHPRRMASTVRRAVAAGAIFASAAFPDIGTDARLAVFVGVMFGAWVLVELAAVWLLRGNHPLVLHGDSSRVGGSADDEPAAECWTVTEWSPAGAMPGPPGRDACQVPHFLAPGVFG